MIEPRMFHIWKMRASMSMPGRQKERMFRRDIMHGMLLIHSAKYLLTVNER